MLSEKPAAEGKYGTIPYHKASKIVKSSKIVKFVNSENGMVVIRIRGGDGCVLVLNYFSLCHDSQAL